MPNFTYTTGRPAGNLTPAQNRPSMTINNDSIASILNVDMIGFNDSNNNSGYHYKITFVDQSIPPTSAASQVVEYASSVTYANAAGTFSELFLNRDAGSAVQMTTGPGNPATYSINGGALVAQVPVQGQTYLPGGMIMKFGYKATSSFTVTYTTPFPNNTLSVVITQTLDGTQSNIVSFDRTKFVYTNVTGSSDRIFWMAIGF